MFRIVTALWAGAMSMVGSGCPQPSTESSSSSTAEPDVVVAFVIEPAAPTILVDRTTTVIVRLAADSDVGPLDIELLDAHSWLSADPLQLKTTNTDGVLTLIASDEAPLGTVTAQLQATGPGVQTATADLQITVAPAPGSPVRTFGEEGKAYFDVAGDDANPMDLFVDERGRIVVSGQARGVISDGMVTRLNADGSTDDTFGIDGAVRVNDHQTSIWHVVPRPKGGVLAFVHGDAALSPTNYALWALSEDGSFDESFGDEGVLAAPFAKLLHGGPDAFVVAGFLELTTFAWDGTIQVVLDSDDDLPAPWDVAFDDQGRLLVLGSQSTDAMVARFGLDDRLDRDFGDRGIAPVPLWTPRAMALHDGAITTFGNSRGETALEEGLRLVGLTEHGQLDDGFGTQGAVDVFDDRGGTEPKFLQQPDGRLIVGPSSTTEGQRLWRYHADGTLDESFGLAGQVQTGRTLDLAMDPVTGQLVVAGFDHTGVYVMRLHL